MVTTRFGVAARFRVGWLAGGVCATAWPLLIGGCASSGGQFEHPSLPPVSAVSPYSQAPTPYNQAITPNVAPANPIAQVTYKKPENGDPPAFLPPPVATIDKPLSPAAGVTHNVPINLDTVLHLAEEHNSQIAVARERVFQGLSEQELASRGWIPQISAGIDYYRHEGGITNEDGTLTHSSFGVVAPGVDIKADVDLRAATIQAVDAERKLWQQRGELSRMTNETLLEAVNTYLDLLAARRGEEIAQDLEKEQRDVLERAEKIANADRSNQVLVEGIQTELAGRRQARVKIHQQGDAAAAKLAYLLGLGADAMPVPVDAMPKPIDLVDATPSTADLVARALQSGPGIQELQSLLAVIQDGFNRLDGPLSLMPTLTLNTSEGAYASGVGGSLTFDNRLDVMVGARWNLTDFLNRKQQTQVALSRIRQAQISLEDLQGKLTAGVREAREAVISGRQEMHEASLMIEHAAKVFELSSLRLKQNVPGSSTTEVMAAVRAQELAHLSYLNAVTAYNKAQIRLLLLLGPASGGPAVAGCEACKCGK